MNEAGVAHEAAGGEGPLPAQGPVETGDSAYIRAGGGVPVNTRKVAGVLVWLCAAALIGVAAWLAALTAHHDSRLNLIRDKGVPVQATVTGCRAISSGIGMGIEYWDCRASYSLDGQQVTASLGGNRKLIDAGARVAAVAVPGRPDLLTTASSARSSRGSGAGYLGAAILAAAGLVLGAARVVLVRRR